MQEIGPRFTLRVKKVYSGSEEKVEGIEFEAKNNMYVDRKSVYLWSVRMIMIFIYINLSFIYKLTA